MGKAKFRPPSRVDALSFPVFGLTWYGAPSSPKNDGCSVIAYCGGGGSAKTGVGNKIVVTVTVDNPGESADDGDSGSSDGNAAHQQHPSQQRQPSSTSRELGISTGEALCFGVHAFRPYNDPLPMARLLACVGDEILLYGIPLTEGEAVLLARAHVGKGYGANVAAYSPLHTAAEEFHHVAVGCENGTTVVYRVHPRRDNPGTTLLELSKVAECAGHAKAVCALAFHPRGTQLLSSAKDGTARVFDVRTGAQLGLLKCEVHDPDGPPPPPLPDPATLKTKDPRMMKRAPQILVRGCGYGDLEGKLIYAVASGKRGPAYLHKWRTLVPLHQATAAGPPDGGGGGAPAEALSFHQEYRIRCSPVPVSSLSFAPDNTIVALGDVDGSMSLYDLAKQRVVKKFPEVHDLPVTCVASRPVPNLLLLPGEEEVGVSFDAVSASADNRLGRWTLQRKSRLAPPPRSRRERGAVERYLWELLRVPFLLMALFAAVAMRDTAELCREEFGLNTLVRDAGASARHCLYREVLWAEESRVNFVPE